MAEPMITTLAASPLHALEIWCDAQVVAARFERALRFELPPMGRWSVGGGLMLARVEPMVWLVEGDVAPLDAILGGDGALTAIGGGIVGVRISGPGWRALLMQGGVFDAEAPAFGPGFSAATIIDHVAVRLLVESDDACLAYVPASYAPGLVHFWKQHLPLLAV